VAIITAILNTLVVLICLFLICLILIQRGKGGGLAGAFGGVGGSSAFGTKAGDVFTRVTVVVAAVWIILSMFLVVLYNRGGQSAWGDDPSVSREVNPKSSTKGKVGTKASPVAPKGEPVAPATTPAPAAASGSSTTPPVSAPAIPDTPAPATPSKK
jgi:preprotein translocase subunit SecG